jgi:hypothetical protein
VIAPFFYYFLENLSMRGSSQIPPKFQASAGDNINPIYKEPQDERVREESQNLEPKKLPAIISGKSKIASTREKVKSLALRSPRGARDPEIVTLVPAHREKPAQGLTKIDPRALNLNLGASSLHPESSGSEVTGFPTITPRPFPRPQHDFLGSRTKNIAIEPIYEGGESSANVPNAESSEKRPAPPTLRPHYTTAELTERARNKPAPPLPGVKPSGSARAKTSSAHRGNLGAVIPSREKQKSSAPEDSWKAASDDADFQERDVEHIDLMPLISENPTGGLTKIKPPSFFEKPNELQSPRSKISTTLRRPIMEKKNIEEALDTADSKEEEIAPAKIRIELVEVHRTLTFSADEHAALLAAEKKMSRIEEFKTPAKLETVGRRSVLPSAINTAKQVTNSIGFLIREVNTPGFASKTMRALNILYYVVDGESVIDRSLHPEIDMLAEYLQALSSKERFAFLKRLYKEVEEHLTSAQRSGLQKIFGKMEREPSFLIDIGFRTIALNLKSRLEDQIRAEN